MLIKFTHPTLGVHLIETGEIIKIVEDATTLEIVAQLEGSKKLEPTDTLDDIFDQQAADGHPLGMILVTNARTGNREIRFVERLLMVVAEVGGGSKIVSRKSKDALTVTESVATILAYQAGPISLGFVSATVSINGQTHQHLFVDKTIERILPSIPSNPASPAIVVLKNTTSYPVTQTVAALYAAQPA